MKTLFNIIFYYFLLILGILDTSWLIWSRFLRPRLPKDSIDIISNHYKELTKKTGEKFSNNGITKEKLINICKKHDENVKSKKPHPLTSDQIKQAELGKQKQKEIQEKKKKEKETKSSDNNNEHNTIT